MSQRVRYIDQCKINEQHNTSKLWFAHKKEKLFMAVNEFGGNQDFII